MSDDYVTSFLHSHYWVSTLPARLFARPSAIKMAKTIHLLILTRVAGAGAHSSYHRAKGRAHGCVAGLTHRQALAED